MKHSKKVAILSPGLDPYKFIDECILLPWLFEKEEPDILWALCSRVPFIKQYSGNFRGILSKPDLINQMVDDDDNLVSNGDEDSSCALFTTDKIDTMIEFRNEYCETQRWKESQNDIFQLLLPFCSLRMRKILEQSLEMDTDAPIQCRYRKTCPHKTCFFRPLSKTNIKKYFHTHESRWKRRYTKSRIKFMGYVQRISSLIKDYKAIMLIREYLYTKIEDMQQHAEGRMKLKSYFGDWKKTPARRKNILLQKLIADMERARKGMNPAGYVGFIGDEPPKSKNVYTRYKQSFREFPYILAKLGVFTKLQCKYKQPDDKCSAVNCLDSRIKECTSLNEAVVDYCKSCKTKETCRYSDRIKECVSLNKAFAGYCDLCETKTKDTCPLKNPCPKGQEKYKNARKNAWMDSARDI